MKKKSGEASGGGCGAGCLLLFLLLALSVFGGLAYSTSGIEQIDALDAMSQLDGEGLRAAEGTEVLVSGRLAADHPLVREEPALVCFERRTVTLTHSSQLGNAAQMAEEDRAHSETPPLRISLEPSVVVSVSGEYHILSSDTGFVGEESGPHRRYDYLGLGNGERVGVRGVLHRSADGWEFRSATLISGDAASFRAHYEGQLYPAYPIGLGLLSLAALLALLGLVLFARRLRGRRAERP